MRRPSYRDRALVVRTYDFAEADRVIVLLTRSHGVVRAVAKGVRRAKSRFGSRLQILVDVNVQIYPGRGLSTITDADTVAWYGADIIEDYERYALAGGLLDVAEKLSPATDEGEELFDATITALNELRHASDPALVVDAFILRRVATAGWTPSLFACAACGQAGPHRAYHPGLGGAVCERCRDTTAAGVDPESLHLMWLLSQRGWQEGEDFPSAVRAEAHRLVVAYVQWHLEQKVPALALTQGAR